MDTYQTAYKLIRDKTQAAIDRISAARVSVENNPALTPDARRMLIEGYASAQHELEIILQTIDAHDPANKPD